MEAFQVVRASSVPLNAVGDKGMLKRSSGVNECWSECEYVTLDNDVNDSLVRVGTGFLDANGWMEERFVGLLVSCEEGKQPGTDTDTDTGTTTTTLYHCANRNRP